MKVSVADMGTAMSELVTIRKEKGCLSDEEMEQVEEFAAEDEVIRKMVKVMNLLSSFVYGVKSQLADQEVCSRRK